MTDRTSQAVTPTDEKLEKMMDEVVRTAKLIGCAEGEEAWHSVGGYELQNAAARAALREYVSATTLTEDDGRAILHALRFGTRLRSATLDKVRDISARRASMKEHPE